MQDPITIGVLATLLIITIALITWAIWYTWYRCTHRDYDYINPEDRIPTIEISSAERMLDEETASLLSDEDAPLSRRNSRRGSAASLSSLASVGRSIGRGARAAAEGLGVRSEEGRVYLPVESGEERERRRSRSFSDADAARELGGQTFTSLAPDEARRSLSARTAGE